VFEVQGFLGYQFLFNVIFNYSGHFSPPRKELNKKRRGVFFYATVGTGKGYGKMGLTNWVVDWYNN